MRRSGAALGVFLALRAGVALLAAAAALGSGDSVGGRLSAADGAWYLRLARAGYPHLVPPGHGMSAQSTLGFFPLLSALIRGVHDITRLPYVAAGLVVTLLAGVLATAAIDALLRERVGVPGAWRGTVLVLVSPAAFVLGMVYSEALLLALVAGSLLALRRRRWLAAGILAGLATATDPMGIAAAAPCAVAAVGAARRGDRRAWLAPATAPWGVVAFFAFLWAWTGSPLAWFTAQRRGWQGGSFGSGIPSAFTQLIDHGWGDANPAVKAGSTLLVATLLIAYLRVKPRAPELAYVLAVLVLAAASPVVAWSPRTLLRAFPLLAVVGARLPARAFPAVVVASTLVMATLAVLVFAPAARPFVP